MSNASNQNFYGFQRRYLLKVGRFCIEPFIRISSGCCNLPVLFGVGELYRVCCAHYYVMRDSFRIDFDGLVNQPLFREIQNKMQFLKPDKCAETVAEMGVYLLRIQECKRSVQISPLTSGREQVRDAMLNQRKIKLVRNLEQPLRKEAGANNLIIL